MGRVRNVLYPPPPHTHTKTQPRSTHTLSLFPCACAHNNTLNIIALARIVKEVNPA